MELLEGNTLKHLIAGKALAIEQVLELGIQIADAWTLRIRRASFTATSSQQTFLLPGAIKQKCWILGWPS